MHAAPTPVAVPAPVAPMVPIKAESKSPAKEIVQAVKIEEDEDMKRMRELLESRIKFQPGNTLEWKKKAVPEPEPALFATEPVE